MTTLILAVASSLLAPIAADSPQGELDRHQGEWTVVSEEFGGRKAESGELGDRLKGLTIAVRGDRVAFRTRGVDRWATVVMDPSKSPRTYDLTRDDGRVLKGIYAWDGQDLKVCTADDQGDRPTEMATRIGSGNRIRTWRRRP